MNERELTENEISEFLDLVAEASEASGPGQWFWLGTEEELEQFKKKLKEYEKENP